MALALDPTVACSSRLTPEVPVPPSVALQARYNAPPPFPSPRLLTAPAMGVHFQPPTFAQYFAQHSTPSFGGQSSGLAGAQHPLGPLPGTVPVQQLLLLCTTPHTAQHIIYPSSLHQVQTPAFIAPHLAPLHGYAGPHAATPGGVMVDP